jgi:hypothetical protein
MHNVSATTQSPTMSAARLAAEAAFTATPAPDSESGEKPVVTVKRNRPVETVDAAERDSNKQQEQVEETRAPRTFRVEHPSIRLPEPAPTGLELGSSSVDGGTETVQPRAPQPALPRKSRRKRHGDVTIIRPSQGMPCPTVAKRRSSRGFVFEIAEIGSSASREYASIMAQIRQLEQRAEAVRKLESSQAVRWIKRAIVHYGLDAADLGLEVPALRKRG